MPEGHVVEFSRWRLLQGVSEAGDGRDAERTASRFQQSNSRSDRRDLTFCGVPPTESCSGSGFVHCGGCEGVRRSTVAGSRRGGPAASARSLFVNIGSAGDIYLRLLVRLRLLRPRRPGGRRRGARSRTSRPPPPTTSRRTPRRQRADVPPGVVRAAVKLLLVDQRRPVLRRVRADCLILAVQGWALDERVVRFLFVVARRRGFGAPRRWEHREWCEPVPPCQCVIMRGQFDRLVTLVKLGGPQKYCISNESLSDWLL